MLLSGSERNSYFVASGVAVVSRSADPPSCGNGRSLGSLMLDHPSKFQNSEKAGGILLAAAGLKNRSLKKFVSPGDRSLHRHPSP
jgi:hypothetical protein